MIFFKSNTMELATELINSKQEQLNTEIDNAEQHKFDDQQSNEAADQKPTEIGEPDPDIKSEIKIENADFTNFASDENYESSDGIESDVFNTAGLVTSAEKKIKKQSLNEIQISKMLALGPDLCDPPNLTCKICEKVFVNIYSLARHMEMHEDNRPFNFTCELCHKGFFQQGHLTKHMRRHVGITRYQCDKCWRSFYELSALALHLKTYHKVEPIPCDMCEKTFYVQQQLDTHRKKHVPENEYVCGVCGKDFRLLCLLKRHEVTHKDERLYHCTLCNKGFKYQSNLRNHNNAYHNEDPGSRYVECEICGKSVKNLRSHMLLHIDARNYECTQCDQAFYHKSRLESHVKAKHSSEKIVRLMRYLCNECGKTCYTATHLRIHMSKHTGEKPFACSFCDKRYVTKYALTTHIRNHTEERPFICTVCTKGFYTNEVLKRHMKVHAAGEKIFQCEFCDRSYKERKLLRTHMKIHNKLSMDEVKKMERANAKKEQDEDTSPVKNASQAEDGPDRSIAEVTIKMEILDEHDSYAAADSSADSS